MVKCLVVRPAGDQVTVYTKVWLGRFIDTIQEGNDVLDINSGEVTPEAVLTAIINENPDFIYVAGHGLPELQTISTVRGNEDLFWIPCSYPDREHNDSNIGILKNKLVYLLSCFCGSKLVPAIGEIGGVSGGYEDEYIFIIDPDRYSPEEDVYANSFGDCANQFAISMIEGKDLQTCLDETYMKYSSEIEAWKRWLDENPDAPSYQRVRAALCARLLAHDRDALVGSQKSPLIAGVDRIGMLIVILLLIAAIIYGSLKREKYE